MPAERASPTFPPRPSLHGIASRAKRVRLRAPRSRRFFLHGSLLKRSRGAGMETSDISDHLKDAHEHGAEKWVAIYIALLAVLLSVCSIGGGNAAKDSTRTNIQASDTWAFYQAKNMRQTSYKLAAEALQLRLTEPGLPEATRKAIEEKLAAHNAEIARLESDPAKGEGKKELAAKAKELEGVRDTALNRDPYFDYAGALLQIAVVLASASIVLGNRLLLVGSKLLALLGFLLMLNGFTLAVNIPFIA